MLKHTVKVNRPQKPAIRIVAQKPEPVAEEVKPKRVTKREKG